MTKKATNCTEITKMAKPQPGTVYESVARSIFDDIENKGVRRLEVADKYGVTTSKLDVILKRIRDTGFNGFSKDVNLSTPVIEQANWFLSRTA